MGLKQKVWETDSYYEKAHTGSLDINHPGIRLLSNLSKGNKKTLDLGCGEGTRLSLLSKNGTGVDISRKAISLAKKKYPKLTFTVGNLEKLKFKDNSFDLVYSAYVFEHLSNPVKVINEVKRILKMGGNLVVICPNYGAPNRASPPFRGSRAKKFLAGLILKSDLSWNKVVPIASQEKYDTDWDTTIEPYSLSLQRFLNRNGFKVIKNIPTWEYELDGAKIHQKVFRYFGNMGIYPFYYWSPHIVIQAKKI